MASALLLLTASAAPRPAAAEASSYASDLVERAKGLGLARDPEWLALGHWRRSSRGWLSHASGPAFFLSPTGRADPEAELEATLRGFFLAPAPGARKHPQCRFPARYAWLKDRLAFDSLRLAEQACSAFDAWRSAMDASGVTLIFANAYLNNPGSMYGHTFLRLRRKSGGAGEDLLDYTVNFSATTDVDNGFLYAVRGIIGSFPGEFSVMPYYLKIQEYTNLECRDLWEYDLDLSSARIERLLEHAWEMGSTYFPYYFFDENCSYQLLTLLDAASPELRLSDGLGPTVTPADTVRAVLARQGLARAPRYRPSYVTQMLARRSLLSPREAALAGRLGRDPREETLAGLAGLSKDRQALVLDSAQDYFRYRAGFDPEQTARARRESRLLLVARGRLGVPSAAVEPAPPAPLEAGHDTARVGLGAGAGRNGPFAEVDYRPTLHDLPASDAGYIPYSQLEMLNLRLRTDTRDGRPYLERFDLVDIVSLSPWDRWVPQVSWKASTGVDQAKEFGCAGPGCMYYDGNAGGGVAAQTEIFRRELYYAFAEADLGAGPVLERAWRAGAGGTAGMILDLTRSWRAICEATYIGYQAGPPRERLRLVSSFRLSRDLELRLTLDRRVPDSEAGASFFLYY